MLIFDIAFFIAKFFEIQCNCLTASTSNCKSFWVVSVFKTWFTTLFWL